MGWEIVYVRARRAKENTREQGASMELRHGLPWTQTGAIRDVPPGQILHLKPLEKPTIDQISSKEFEEFECHNICMKSRTESNKLHNVASLRYADRKFGIVSGIETCGSGSRGNQRLPPADYTTYRSV